MTITPVIKRIRSQINGESGIALLVLGFGFVLRFRSYFQNNSFWLDEAMLVLNIIQRTFSGLVQPLDYDQGAPIIFLWIEKLAQILFGNNELSFRLFPFLAGCIALILFWLLVRKLNQPVGAIFALLMLACGRYFVFYGVQVKQYIVDVLITLLIYLAALHFVEHEPGKREYWFIGMLGAFAIWTSHTVIFTLPGVSLVLLVLLILKKGWRAAINAVPVLIFWLINFIALYFIQFTALNANNTLTDYWSDYFMPLSFSAPFWILKALAGLFYFPGELSVDVLQYVVVVIFLLGLTSLFLRKNYWVWMFSISLLLTLMASSLGKYPFGGRMVMFAIPGLLICAGAGLDVIRGLSKTRPGIGLFFTLLLAGGLVFSPLSYSVQLAIKPKLAENIAPTMAFLQKNVRPGDAIYLYRMSIPAFLYYAPKYQLETVLYFEGGDYHLDRQGYKNEVDQVAANKRTWFLFSHLTDPEYEEDRAEILKQADLVGKKKREFNDPGTGINLYLYDFGK